MASKSAPTSEFTGQSRGINYGFQSSNTSTLKSLGAFAFQLAGRKFPATLMWRLLPRKEPDHLNLRAVF